MLANYFRIAFRNLIRNRSYAIINISGIAVGMTAFALFAFYIFDELSYDKFHTKADRIVRVVHHAAWDGNEVHHAVTSAAFAPALKSTFPEVEQAVRILPEGGGIITYNEKVVEAGGVVFADKDIFNVFTYPFLYGDSTTALSQPQSIVLTETLAKKLFDDPAKALNQTVYFDGNYPNKVTGVIKDVPSNSHIGFEGIRSLREGYTSNWANSDEYTYLLLHEGVDYKSLEAKMPAFAANTIEKEMTFNEYRIELQPIKSIHLYSDLQFELGTNGSINRVYMFAALAFLILMIAVINYMNLSTARAFLRIKEVGIRKVIGSDRTNLASMFITDAMVISVIATVTAFVLTSVLLPLFNSLADKNLTLWRFGVYQPLLMFAAFALLIGLISGSYPAWFLSRFKTTSALKGLLGDLSDSVLIRKSLVVFQFVVTIIMISGSAIIYRQMQFISNKDLGFNKDQVLTFHIDDRAVRERMPALKTQLLRNPLIQSAAAAGNPIGNNNLGDHAYFFETFDGSISTTSTIVQELVVDADYIPTMEIDLVDGRNFSADITTDKTSAAIVNETLVQELGWEKPVGKKARFIINDGETSITKEVTVIGVVKDFHTYSLQHKVEPIVLLMPAFSSMEDNLYVRIDTRETEKALASIETTFREFDKANPLTFDFLDQNFSKQYEAEQKQERLSMVFTLLAVFIACLGLFGLSAFTAQQKVKEIGIRKVLGASISSIIGLLSASYVRLVLIAAVFAVPAGYWMMQQWLGSFAYRVDTSWWIFAAAGIVALLIALVTVSLQAYRAAVSDPVKSLRSE